VKKNKKNEQLFSLLKSRFIRTLQAEDFSSAWNIYLDLRLFLNNKRDYVIIKAAEKTILPKNNKLNRVLYPELDRISPCGRYLR
jgi:hypothetical protein